ncbi:MAG: saccharopine dehydrogenase NADP-binding domain-containing protein, partial [Xanthomonadales bacterium]|nr:saccharopine dehydrogenase NADP-binding domain-containing protein [Xanthomonadales bacterium]
MSAVAEWLIYGAYGYSGQLIVRQAVDRGLRPVLGGRDQARLKAMAEPLGLSTRTFAVDEVGALKQGLDGINLVLNCAGPFSATAASMLEGCLQLGAHYLDISGEIEVFRHAHAQDQRARSRGLVVCPGVGFDVVPTDCMAALLKRELADAQRL